MFPHTYFGYHFFPGSFWAPQPGPAELCASIAVSPALLAQTNIGPLIQASVCASPALQATTDMGCCS